MAQQFHKSTQLTYDLREKQKLLSDGPSLELIQSCPTRWGSTTHGFDSSVKWLKHTNKFFNDRPVFIHAESNICTIELDLDLVFSI